MIIDNLFRLVRFRKSSTVSLIFFLCIFTFIILFTQGISYAALLQSTYLGGNGNETGHAIAIHPTTGDIYVTGTADGHVFVSRLSGNLNTLYQTTSFGGSDGEEGYAIAIHPTTGDVYVTGNTTSPDFPGLTNGADTTFAGYNEAFVARLSGDLLTLHQSTFLGGDSYDAAYGIAIHPTTGDVYVTGVTNSGGFPGASGSAAGDDVFVTRLSGNLQTVYQTTLLGGSSYDSGSGIAIHPTSGDIYVTGTTGSGDFSGIAGGSDATFAGDEAFVARLSSDLLTLHQSTYLGGSGDESGCGIAIHPTHGIYVTGHTFSNKFPGIAGGADTTFSNWTFATETINTGTEGDDTQINLGTPENDFILQNGGAGNDDLACDGGLENEYIHESGGPGDDTMRVAVCDGDDLVIMDAGRGNDTTTYDVSAGTDYVFIDGGTGNDSLTIDAGVFNFTLLNMKEETLFQQGMRGSMIWVRSVENITVLDPDEDPLYQVMDTGDTTGGPDTSYCVDGPGEAFVAVLDFTIIPSLDVVWQDSTPGNNEIYMKKSTDGGTTWTQQRLTRNKGSSEQPMCR